MRMIIALVLFLLLSEPLFAQTTMSQPRRPLVFTHVTVVDVSGVPPKSDMTVIVAGHRIVATGKTGKVRVPQGAEVIDTTGKYLIPGLWDMHTHVAFTTDFPNSREIFFPLLLVNGITGVRDMGGELEALNQWRREIADGKLLGPRIVVSGPMLDGPKPLFSSSVAVDGKANGRQAVISLKRRGADFIKVQSLLSREVYFAIAGEARRQKITFAGHVPDSVRAAEASDAGQKSMEHLLGIFIACSAREAELMSEVLKADANAEVWVYFDRVQIKAPESYDARKCADLFARFVKNGTWQVPTLISEHNYWHIAETKAPGDPLFRYIPRDWVKKELELVNNAVLKERTAADVASGKQLFRKQSGLVSAMHRAGVRLLAGTDTPGWFALPGFSLHDELALLVAAGLTPLAALQTATINPAKFLGREKELGTVEKGKLADLVLLDANPLSDINNTRKISAVVVNGRYLPKETLQQMLAEVEAAANQ